MEKLAENFLKYRNFSRAVGYSGSSNQHYPLRVLELPHENASSSQV
jgi:hypothetical protein